MPRRVPGLLTARILGVSVVALAALTTGFAAPSPALAASVVVRITDTVEPKDLQVVVGTTVTWVNESGNRHKIRSTSGPSDFDGDLEAGESFSVTFNGTGTWQYVDDRDRDDAAFWGSVSVSRTATPTPKPTATPPPGSAPTPTQAPPPGDILMAGRVFNPRSLTVDVGTTVRWRNNDDRDHTVTANDRSFDSGIMREGATWSRTFNTAGTYAYICALHPDMTGTIAVRGAGGATPPPPSPTPKPTPTPVPATPAPGSTTVTVADYSYRPTSIDVIVGTTITWINNGAALHTVTASDGSFDSGLMAAGTGRYSRRFPTPGTFPYLCTLHPEMTAVVRVSGPGGETPPPAAPPTPASTPAPVATPAPGSGEVAILDFDYAPVALEVAAGDTVTWVNRGIAPHTVTATDGSYDSGFLQAGGTWSRTFDAPGTYDYLCTIHPAMVGTVVVGEARAAGGTAGGGTAGGGTVPEAVVPSVGPGAVEAPGSVASESLAPTDGTGGPSALEPVAQAMTAEQYVRLALVLLLGVGAVATFMRLVRGVARGA